MKMPDVPDTNVGKINGKTPEEIKKGLKCRKNGYAETCSRNCQECALFIPKYSISERYADALAYIQQLESRLAQAERERDAAVIDLRLYAGCKVCKHGDFEFTHECMDCSYDNNNWEWRGVCEETTKEET